MQSQLRICFKLKERTRNDPEFEKAIYYAYNKKKDYGEGVCELPVHDNENLRSEIGQRTYSMYHSSILTCSGQSSEEYDPFEKKSRAGSFLKLKT